MTTPIAASDVESRLATLERRNRRLSALVGLMFLFLIVLLVWQVLPGQSVVSASTFEVRDRQGRVRAELGMRHDGTPWLRLNNEAGKARALLFMRPEGGPAFRLTDDEGRHRSEWSLAPDGTPHLDLAGDDGHTRAVLEVAPGNRAGFTIRTPTLQPGWSAPNASP